MRKLILTFLLCIPAFAADTGVKLASTVTTTNNIGQVRIIDTKETFTRGGQTNLIRKTWSQDGVIISRSHEFYHHGDRVAILQGTPNPTEFHTRQELPYQVSLQFGRSVHILGEDFNDAFYCTNGEFYPAPDSDLAVLRDMSIEQNASKAPLTLERCQGSYVDESGHTNLVKFELIHPMWSTNELVTVEHMGPAGKLSEPEYYRYNNTGGMYRVAAPTNISK